MSIEDIYRQYSVPIAPAKHEHSRPGWIQTDCPACTPNSRRWRLGFNLRGKYFSCWACGYRPLIPTLVALLGQPATVVRGLVQNLPSHRHHDVIRAGKLVLPDGLGPLMECHRDYLRSRGFIPEVLEQVWGLKGIGLAKSLAFRVFIPFHLDGEVVSWLTRGITDTARHRSASADEEAIDHKTLLYGEDHAQHAIAIHEGPTDVWAVGPGAVATCGISYRRAQILRMARFPVRVICFNSEPEAQKRASKLCKELSVFKGETYNVQYSVKDACEAMNHCPDEIEYIRKTFLGRT